MVPVLLANQQLFPCCQDDGLTAPLGSDGPTISSYLPIDFLKKALPKGSSPYQLQIAMSYYQTGSNTPDPDRLCVYPSPSSQYYSGGTGYFGLQEWFDFSHLLMSNAVRPMVESEQKELFNNIQNGKDISSLVELGRHQAKLPLTNYVTLLGIVTVFLIFLRTFFSHWKKRQLIPVQNQNSKSRCSALPTIFITGPLMFFTLLLGIVFSFGLYYTYKGILKYDRNIHNGIADRPINLQNELLFEAQCQYDTMFIRGSQKLLHEIHEANDHVADSCQPTVYLLGNRLETIQRDQDSLEELLRRSDLLKEQLKEAQSLNMITDEEDVNDINYTQKTIKKIEEQLKTISKVLGELNKNVTKNLIEGKEKGQSLRDEVRHLTAPLVDAVTETVSRVGQVKHSLDEATKTILAWTSKVATRIMRAMETERGRIDPLIVFASLQGLLGVGVICALTALGAGSVVLGLTIVWPKPFYYAPRATGFVIQLFLCSLCIVSAFTFSILFLSGMFLSFSGPITSICDTLNKVHGNNSSNFYIINDIHFELKDYNGTVHTVNFGEFLGTKEVTGRGLAAREVNQRVDLLPRLEDEIKLNLWTSKLDEIEDPDMPNLTYPSSPLARQLKMSALALETVSFKEFHSEKARRSPLLNLVSKELQTFKRLIDAAAFDSLDSAEIPGCHIRKLDDSVKDNMEVIFALSFGELQKKMERKFYRSDRIMDTYLGSSRLLCVDYLIPSTACWLASFLLGFTMLLDMLIIKKVAHHLNTVPPPGGPPEDGVLPPGPLIDKRLFQSAETTQVSFDSPLLEEKSFDAAALVKA